MSDAAPEVISPCVKVCTLDAEARLCLGCLRTLEEIGMWPRYSDAERRAVMARLPGRARLGADRKGLG